METEILEVKPSLTKNTSGGNTLQSFNLPSLIRKMKHDCTWAQGELNTKILLKSFQKQVILIAMHEGTEINSFQSNDAVTIQLIEGALKFHTRKGSANLENGQLVTLHEKIAYSLTTKQDTVILLTITNRILQEAEN
jgi:hypothetical protein